MNVHQARSFLYRNARPLDLARWKYFFEGGSPEDVLTALAAYQNDDGGFGHALEPDCWNPDSSPIQTWVATEIIHEIGLGDQGHPVVQGILRYLSSGKDFDGHTWANTIASNNRAPHAPWWEHVPAAEPSYNPTASLIAFILKFADQESRLFALACKLAKEAYAYCQARFPIESAHTVVCFVRLYDCLKESAAGNLVNLAEFKTLLQKQLRMVIPYDTDKWAAEYVCKPSLLIRSRASDFYEENRVICEYECSFIENTQEPDGAWAITWSWADYPEEWSISKNWWKSDWIIKNLLYVKMIREDISTGGD